MKPFQIAIDGPVSAGCSTTARLLAKRLGFLYIDTGAMYRSVALLALRHQVDPADETALVKLVKKSELILRQPTDSQQNGRLITVLLDGEDISWEIRTAAVSQIVPIVAAHAQIRKILVKKQQQIAADQDVVMEGRDIAVRVLPQANLKIFLTAAELVRAKRQLVQEQAMGRDASLEEIHQELAERDKRDRERTVDLLQPVAEAVIIDTSDITIDEVIDQIINLVSKIRKN